jgi:glucose/arabinose dehydrogenase
MNMMGQKKQRVMLWLLVLMLAVCGCGGRRKHENQGRQNPAPKAMTAVTAAQNKNPVKGVWKLISKQKPLPDGTIVHTEDEWQLLKIVTAKHFVFVEQAPKRPRFTAGGTDAEMLAAAKTFFAGGGTYAFAGSTYSEHITYFFIPNYIGTTIRFNCEFRGDLWILSGMFPVKSVGVAGNDYELVEVWQRLE